jgi:hypothetical protein
LLAEAHGPSSGAAKRQSIKDIALVMTPEGPVADGPRPGRQAESVGIVGDRSDSV